MKAPRVIGMLGGMSWESSAQYYRLHRIIYDELCQGLIREESRQVYRDVIMRLVRAGAEGVVLGCTEIELLISATDSPVPVFPTTRLHVKAAVAVSLATRSNV
jgi:aspartate racemase